MISCPAAKQIRCVKPSITTLLPGFTLSASPPSSRRSCFFSSSRIFPFSHPSPKDLAEFLEAVFEDAEGHLDLVRAATTTRERAARIVDCPQERSSKPLRKASCSSLPTNSVAESSYPVPRISTPIMNRAGNVTDARISFLEVFEAIVRILPFSRIWEASLRSRRGGQTGRAAQRVSAVSAAWLARRQSHAVPFER